MEVKKMINTKEIKMALAKALLTTKDFVNELISAIRGDDAERKFNEVMQKNGFPSELTGQIAKFSEGKFAGWKLNLEKLSESNIQNFIPNGVTGYY
jgi:hypothetical protein